MFGENLEKLRSISNTSRNELASVLDVSATAVYKWENNLSEPSIAKLIRLADYFGVSIDELVDHNPRYARTPREQRIRQQNRSFSCLTVDEREKLLLIGNIMFGLDQRDRARGSAPAGEKTDADA